MPKILIKEFDNTSAGTPGNYANYAVLITGYMGRTPILTADVEAAKAAGKTGEELPVADKVQPDSNGVYEFTSAGDFEKVIGRIDYKSVGTGDSARTEYHYGNKMAYELLNMGYTVIYKTIEQIADMKDEDFWAPFYDKASYDFRFVSHGMLETNHDETNYKAITDRLEALEADVAEFIEITSTVDEANPEASAEELTTKYEEAYGASANDRFLDNSGRKYASYAAAKTGLRFTTGTDGKMYSQAVAAQEALKLEHDNTCITPTVFNDINSNIAKLAAYTTDDNGNAINSGRGDCIALVELAEGEYAGKVGKPEINIINGIKGMPAAVVDNGAYCAMTVPSVYYNMSGEIKKFPGAFHYLACFMNSLRSGFSEWYAAAGYTRGVCGYSIDHTSVKLGEIAINALEPRNLVEDESKVQPTFACNVIANFRGSYYLWGNRTAFKLYSEKSAKYNDLTASSFLNIRQLCTTIKKQLYVACRRFTFDPNSDTLWFNFVNAITPTLDAMKADQGIRDYRVIKVFTDKKATMKAKIRIIPIEAVEDFDIEVSLEDSFGGVSVNAN